MNRSRSPNDRQFKAPLLNEYKLKFVVKRLIQTLLGGCLLKFDYEVPAYVYAYQIIIYTIPFIIGGIGVLIGDVATQLDRTHISIIDSVVFVTFLITFKVYVQAYVLLKTTKGVNTIAKQSRLDDEEHYDFPSCHSIELFYFILPQMVTKSSSRFELAKFLLRLLFDCVLSGFIMFCSCYFLSLTYLYSLYGYGVNILIFVLSWITICNGLYASCIRQPTESAITNVFSEYFNVNYTSRSLYIALLYIIEMVYGFAPDHGNIPLVLIQIIKILFVCYPVLWFFGVLPPFNIFFWYILEQSYIYLYGGTPTATTFRLIFQLLQAVALSFVYFLSNDIVTIALLSAFGFIFSSIDLLHVYSSLKELYLTRHTKVMACDSSYLHHTSGNFTPSSQTSKNRIPWSTALRLAVMLSLTLLCSMLIINLFPKNAITPAATFQVIIALLYTCVGIFVLCKACSLLQSTYIFGIIRNPFYGVNYLDGHDADGKQQSKINENKLFFMVLMYIRMILIKYVAPLVLCAVVTLDCYVNKVYNDTTYGYMRTLFVLRAYRWIWQSTYTCLIEMSLMAHLLLFTILYNTISDTTMRAQLIQSYLPVCMLASLVYDRLTQFFNKLYAFFLITITSWTLKGQKTNAALCCMIVNFILLVPVTLPIICASSVLNAPLLPLFTFPIYIIGYPRLKRFWPQDFIKNTEILTNTDSLFYAQLIPSLKQALKKCIQYSSIDDLKPEMYFISRFQDRIIWIQVLETSYTHCVIEVKGLELQETSCHTIEAHVLDDAFELAFNNPNGADSNSSTTSCVYTNPYALHTFCPCDVIYLDTYSDAKNTLVGILDNTDSFECIKMVFPKILHYFLIRYLIEQSRRTAVNRPNTVFSMQSSKKPEETSIKEESELQPIQQQTESSSSGRVSRKTNIKASLDEWPDDDTDSLFGELNKLEKKFEAKKSVENDDENEQTTDTYLTLPQPHLEHLNKFNKLPEINNKPFKSFTKIDASSVLSIPTEWIELIEGYGISSRQYDEYLSVQQTLETDAWIRRLLEISELGAGSIDDTCTQYTTYQTSNHFLFLLSCCNFLGFADGSRLNPSAIYKLYKGDLPWKSAQANEVTELQGLIVRAFRYTIKFAIDCMTIMPCTTDDEFFEMMDVYESQWYIGLDDDKEYLKNVKDNRPFIFSLFYEPLKKIVNSRTLTLQKIKAPLAYLNTEIVKSIWSSTNLELLYMTNDDDERYSIQAHPFLLRNLTIQASDPPLGYPIYKSEPIYVAI